MRSNAQMAIGAQTHPDNRGTWYIKPARMRMAPMMESVSSLSLTGFERTRLTDDMHGDE